MTNFSWQLAMDLWRGVVDGYLVTGGRKANERRGETPSQLIGGTLHKRLTEHQPYWRGLLAPSIHSRRQGISFADHIAQEADVYSLVMMRRIILTSQALKQTPDGRADLTNAHRLLLALLPFVSPREDWQTPTLDRIPAPAQHVVPAADIPARTLAERITALWDAEQARHQQALETTGAQWGFGRGSSSPSWIGGYDKDGRRPNGTWGILHLQVGGVCIPMPEELGMADVFDCLPNSLDRKLIDEFREGLVALLGEGADDDAAADESIAKVEKKASENQTTLPPGYAVWRLFRRIVENLNDPYGAMIKAGIPSSAMFPAMPDASPALTRTDCDTLKELRLEACQQAVARLRDRHPPDCPPEEDPRSGIAVKPAGVAMDIQESDWENAWTVLFTPPKKAPKRYVGGFRDFRQSIEGQALLNIRWLEVDAESSAGRLTPDALTVAADDTPIRLDAWVKSRSLTGSELLLALPALTDGEPLDSMFTDPALIAATDAAMTEEIPYRLVPDPNDRRDLLRFFFVRRICILQGFGCVRRKDKKGWLPAAPTEQGDLPMTDAEQIVLEIVRKENDTHRYPDRNASRLYQTAILTRLRAHGPLAKALGRFPYNVAGGDDRLRLMLFFYCRDIEGSLIRPE